MPKSKKLAGAAPGTTPAAPGVTVRKKADKGENTDVRLSGTEIKITGIGGEGSGPDAKVAKAYLQNKPAQDADGVVSINEKQIVFKSSKAAKAFFDAQFNGGENIVDGNKTRWLSPEMKEAERQLGRLG